MSCNIKRFALLLLLIVPCCAEVVFEPQDEKGTKATTGGRFRVAYDNAQPCIDTIVMVNVGTAMSVGDYSVLSEMAVRDSSIAFVMADNQPSFGIKQAMFGGNGPRDNLACLADYVMNNITSYVHKLCQDISHTKFILGGHSASGITAGEVVLGAPSKCNTTRIDGYLGINPFYKRLPISFKPWSGLNLSSVPSMLWGHSMDSCGVTVDSGGLFGYKSSSDEFRVLYQTQLDKKGCGHCDVTNEGCGRFQILRWTYSACKLSDRSESVKAAVASSIRKFAKAIQQDGPRVNFNRQFLAVSVSSPLKVKLFVNTDASSNGGLFTEEN